MNKALKKLLLENGYEGDFSLESLKAWCPESAIKNIWWEGEGNNRRCYLEGIKEGEPYSVAYSTEEESVARFGIALRREDGEVKAVFI